MDFEKEIQDYLMDKGGFDKEETIFNKNIYFEFSEFKICNGRIDILGYDEDRKIYVIELKRGKIDANALVQCKNYMINLERLLTINNIKFKKINGILIGNSIDDRTETVLSCIDNIAFIKFEKAYKFLNDTSSADEEYYKQFKDDLGDIKNMLLCANGGIE